MSPPKCDIFLRFLNPIVPNVPFLCCLTGYEYASEFGLIYRIRIQGYRNFLYYVTTS